MKKNFLIILIVLGVGLLVSIGFNIKLASSLEKTLPKQELEEGLRGVYGIDKNINEKTIDNYLGRSCSENIKFTR